MAPRDGLEPPTRCLIYIDTEGCSLGDLSGGKGSRPVVRFRLIDGEDFEKRVLQNPLAEINEEKQTG